MSTTSAANIQNLIQKSKRLQNKWKQNQASEYPPLSSVRSESVPPIWADNNILLNEYVQDVVRDVLDENGYENLAKNHLDEFQSVTAVWRTVRPEVKEGESKERLKNDHCLSYRPVSLKNTILSSKTSPKTKVLNLLKESPIPSKPTMVNLDLDNSKTEKTERKRTPRIQYCRYTGLPKDSLKKSFREEHPNLVLIDDGESFFPRRCTPSKVETTPTVEEDENPITLQPPKIVQRTWHDDLMHTKVMTRKRDKPPKATEKVLHLKVQPEQLSSNTRERQVIYDSPTIHKIDSSTENRKKCHLQRFPVLCIRGENKVQNVLKLSIQPTIHTESMDINIANGEEMHQPLAKSNVQYFEFVHQNQKKSTNLDDKYKKDALVDDNVEKPVHNTKLEAEREIICRNKFFIPFHEIVLSKSSADESETTTASNNPETSSEHKTSSRSIYNLPKQVEQQSEILSSTTDTDEVVLHSRSNKSKSVEMSTDISSDVVNIIKGVFGQVTEKIGTTYQKEAYIQTYEVIEEDKGHFEVINFHSARKPKNVDIVADVFHKIQNDQPDGLKSFKNRLNDSRWKKELCSNRTQSAEGDYSASGDSSILSHHYVQKKSNRYDHKAQNEKSVPSYQSGKMKPSSYVHKGVNDDMVSTSSSSKTCHKSRLKQSSQLISPVSKFESNEPNFSIPSLEHIIRCEQNIYLRNSTRSNRKSSQDPEVKRAVQMFLEDINIPTNFSYDESCLNENPNPDSSISLDIDLNSDILSTTSSESLENLDKTFSINSVSSEDINLAMLSEGEVFSLGEV